MWLWLIDIIMKRMLDLLVEKAMVKAGEVIKLLRRGLFRPLLFFKLTFERPSQADRKSQYVLTLCISNRGLGVAEDIEVRIILDPNAIKSDLMTCNNCSLAREGACRSGNKLQSKSTGREVEERLPWIDNGGSLYTDLEPGRAGKVAILELISIDSAEWIARIFSSEGVGPFTPKAYQGLDEKSIHGAPISPEVPLSPVIVTTVSPLACVKMRRGKELRFKLNVSVGGKVCKKYNSKIVTQGKKITAKLGSLRATTVSL